MHWRVSEKFMKYRLLVITINAMMPKFYDYIVAAELAEKPYTEPPAVTIVNFCLYLNEENVWGTKNCSKGWEYP